MQDWMPYLKELLGEGRAAMRQAQELTTLRDMLARAPGRRAVGQDAEPADVGARLGLLEWVGELDSVRRTFLLPWTLGLLADPSRAVARAMVRDVRELMGGGDSALLDALDALAEEPREPKQVLTRTLDAIEDLVEVEAARELEGEFSAVLALRTPVLGVAALLGVTRWIAARPGDRATLEAHLRDFFADEERARLRDALHAWAVSGPLFLRYLVVSWIGEAQLPLAPNEPARDLLRARYEADLNPLVAGAAVLGYAARVPAEKVGDTVGYLYEELASFHHRSLAFETGDAVSALRSVSVSVFRALGAVAVEHFPDPRPLARFVEALRTPPADRLDLLALPLEEAARAKAARAALILRGRQTNLRVRPDGRGMTGTAGFDPPLKLHWKQALRAAPLAGDYWARPSHPRDGAADPADPGELLDAPFHVFEPAPADAAASPSLLGLITPMLRHMAEGTGLRATMQGAIAEETDQRGPWIRAACDLACTLLRRMRELGHPLGEEPARSLFAYVAGVGVAANLLDFKSPDREALKNTMVRLFLNDFCHPDAFERLRGDGSPDIVTTRFILFLAEKAAQRSLPEAPESAWVDGNLALIRSVAGSRGDRYNLLRAAVLLHGLPPSRRGLEPVAPEVSVDDVRKSTAAACFLSDAVLHDKAAELEAPRDAAEPGAERDPLEDYRLAMVAEILARALERESPADAQSQAGACLRKLLLPPGAVPSDLATLRPPLRRRLLAAYAGCVTPLEGAVLRLRDRLVRSASSAELEYFLAIRRSRSSQLTDSHLYRLLRELLAQTRGYAAEPGGRRLDSQAIEDRLLRRPVILRELERLAKESPNAVFDGWTAIIPPPAVQAPQGPAVAASGWLLPTPAARRRGPHDEVLAKVTRFGTETGDLAARRSELLAAFAYLPPGTSEVRGVVRGVEAGPAVLDLHALPPEPAEREAALDAHLQAGAARLLGRVVSVGTGTMRVDIGVGPPRPVPLPKGADVPDEDSAVPLDARWGERTVPDQLRLKYLRVPGAGVPIHDLRALPDPVARLSELGQQAGGGEVLLRASITRRREVRTGDLQCLLDTGVQHYRDGEVCPMVIYAPPSEAPEEGAEIVVGASELRFRQLSGREAGLELRLAESPAAAGDEVVAATLHSTHSPAGRRLWTARFAGREVPLNRRQLTANLALLHRLDGLDDDDPALARLAREPLAVAVREGTRGSVLGAPARWIGHDLVVGVMTGRVEAVTVLAAAGEDVVVEAHPRGSSTDGPLTSALGWLARIDPAEVFDAGTGMPFGRAELPRGTRLRLEVRPGTLGTDGFYQEWSGEGEGKEWQEPFLISVGEPDNPVARMLDIFAHRASITVAMEQRGGAPCLVLREPIPEGIDRPRLEPAGETFRREVGWTGEAVVDEDAWDPFDADYTVHVAEPRMHEVELGANPAPAAERLFHLEPGDSLDGVRLVRTRSGPLFFANHLPVRPDPLLQYLLPEELGEQALRRGAASVRLTDLQPRRAELDVTPPDLAALGERGILRGLVIGTGVGEGLGSDVRVRWVEGLRGDEWAASQVEWTFQAPPDPSIQNGSHVEVAREHGRVVVRYLHRQFFGTLLHRLVPLSSVRLRDGERLRATLVEKGGNEGEWVFATADAQLVRVPAAAIGEREKLAGGAPGDPVLFEAVAHPQVSGRVVLRFRERRAGPLHALRGARCELEGKWRDHRDRSWACTLKAVGSTLPPLRLRVPERGLPPGTPAERGEVRPFKVECTVRHYELRLIPPEAADRPSWVIEFVPTLDRYVELPPAQVPEPRKPGLAEELDLMGGRLPPTSGRAVALGGGIGVKLLEYHGEPVVPLPEAEQTWVAHTGELVSLKWRGSVVVFADAEGRPVASLRRLPPSTLPQWIGSRRRAALGARVQLENPLLHFGVLSPDDQEECGLVAPAADAQPLVLFEAGPGIAFVATPAELRFMGEPFVTRALQAGDRVAEYASFREEAHRHVVQAAPGEQPLQEPEPLLRERERFGIDLLRVELGLRHDVEQFAREKGVFFGRLEVDEEGVGVAALHGLGFRSGPDSPSQRARWRLRLVDDATTRALHDRTSPEERYYLHFVEADPARGELRFRVLTDEEVFREANLVFVRPGQPYQDRNGVWHLEVHPLQGGAGRRFSISDTVFSVRLGRLEVRVGELPKEYLLARVTGVVAGAVHRLSLTDVSPRRFPFLLRHLSSARGRAVHAIVKRSRPDRTSIDVELKPGLNAELPRARIVGPHRGRSLAEGDVLTLLLSSDEAAAEVVDVVPGHLAYLHPEWRPTFLTLLWQQPERRDPGKPLHCSLVGLSQLACVCEDHVHIDAVEPVPQQVRGLTDNRRWVRVASGIGPDARVGRLTLTEGGLALVQPGEAPLPIAWRDATFGWGFAADLAEALAALRWRNKAGGPEEAISHSDVVAACDPKTRRGSLVAGADAPLPVDHLAEQFVATDAADRLSFVVARAERHRVVLEVAAGRYVEVPTTRLEPLRDARFSHGHRATGVHFARGDVLTLEQVEDREDIALGIPRFRVVELRPGPGRSLAVPYLTVLASTPRGPVLGPAEGGIPAEHAFALLRRAAPSGAPHAGERRPRPLRVHGQGWKVEPAGDPPRTGDSVMVTGEVSGDRFRLRALGLEGVVVQWAKDPHDPLQLHLRERRESLLPALLGAQGAFLWTTVEEVDPSGGRVLLSRARQLEAVVPAPGGVTYAYVTAVLDRGELLMDLLGVPVTLPAGRFCHGGAPRAALQALVSRASGGRLLVEVTTEDDGALSCTAVYPAPPLGSDFGATIEALTDVGLVAACKGARIFVSAADLGWCELSPAALRCAFTEGQPIRLRAGDATDGRRRYSHVATRDIRNELRSLARRSGDAVYVRRVHVPAEARPVLARTLSGLLMEMRLNEGEEMPAAAPAYVQEVDEVSRRVLLTLHEVPPRRWLLPCEPDRDRALDAVSHDVVRARGLLQATPPFAAAAALCEWLDAQPMLEASPRNLRLVLEAAHRLAGLEPGWPGGAGGNTPLSVAVRDFHALVTGATTLEQATVPALFASGYRALLVGDPESALPPLREANARREPRWHFDVGFAYARAAYLAGRRRDATRFLRRLLEALWSGALRTLPLSIPAPPSLAPVGQDVDAWFHAAAGGDLDALTGMLARRSAASLLEVGSPQDQWRRLWAAMARGEFGAGFDRAAENFFQAVNDARCYGLSVPAAVEAAAAQLAFACGDHDAALQHLEHCRAAAQSPAATSGAVPPELQVARFWAGWVTGQTTAEGGDPLLRALHRLLLQSRWRAECSRAAFDTAWEEFRGTPHRWVIEGPGIRIVPAPPAGEEERSRWAVANGATEALPYLGDLADEDPPA